MAHFGSPNSAPVLHSYLCFRKRRVRRIYRGTWEQDQEPGHLGYYHTLRQGWKFSGLVSYNWDSPISVQQGLETRASHNLPCSRVSSAQRIFSLHSFSPTRLGLILIFSKTNNRFSPRQPTRLPPPRVPTPQFPTLMWLFLFNTRWVFSFLFKFNHLLFLLLL